MDFPKERMEIVSHHGGKESEEGWLVLNLGPFDLEGITKIYVNLDDIADIRRHGERRAEVLEQMRSLLGCDD
ncbi:MAG TPA: hypothetical protein PLU39_08740 [Armatimonadota bacterium]|jgi:hypothetical protein|nr:hypothetical protein [Armatimonadota bacterium]HOJ21448.1 hypothetical protein [Armatimonadota bacterium]HOM81224.1 hypothetical protein [Armatimonadota bacterium]HPO74628.1 hypothetical protein [Armatimonadota bacterium]HPT97942.1 hypothetical protein [Armatimonadota bacterium]